MKLLLLFFLHSKKTISLIQHTVVVIESGYLTYFHEFYLQLMDWQNYFHFFHYLIVAFVSVVIVITWLLWMYKPKLNITSSHLFYAGCQNPFYSKRIHHTIIPYIEHHNFPSSLIVETVFLPRCCWLNHCSHWICFGCNVGGQGFSAYSHCVLIVTNY